MSAKNSHMDDYNDCNGKNMRYSVINWAYSLLMYVNLSQIYAKVMIVKEKIVSKMCLFTQFME